MSLLPASADLKARVARLKLCNCKSNWTDPHLTIERDHIPLQRGEATAISYVWGEFDRRDVPVGHPPGKSDDVIRMELGIEWITQDVIHRLAEVAADRPIWMDQLCIPQNDEEIRKTLASIATIYKTFDVAILLPGHSCACLPQIVKDLEARAAEEGKDRDADGDGDTRPDLSDFCLNVCPLSSWMSRLWTFQELGFSQSVRCVWVSKDVAKCIFPHTIPTNVPASEESRLVKSIAETDLQPYAAIWFRRTLSAYLKAEMEERIAVNTAWSYLQSLSLEFLAQAHFDIAGFEKQQIFAPWVTSIRAFEHVRFYRFLNGEVIQRDMNTFLELEPSLRLFQRIPFLKRRGSIHRKATHARDYVIAVFAEIPSYSPPPNYRNEEVPILLQHAMDWYRRERNNVAPLSTAPQGLFMPDAAESFLWRPAYYLSPDRIRAVNDVYQTILGIVVVRKVGTCDSVPLSYHIAECIPLSARAKSWESFHGDFAEPDFDRDVAAELKNTIRGWNDNCRSYIVQAFHEGLANLALDQDIPTDNLQIWHHCTLLMDGIIDSPKKCHDCVFSTTQLHLAFYELVCRSLFLDRAFCWEKGVKLMFSPPTEYRQYTRVGLCRGDVKLCGEQAHDSNQIIAHQSLTVGLKDVLFEAERIYEDLPAYRVFGVWVPMQDKFKDDIGAIYDEDNPLIDAFLL